VPNRFIQAAHNQGMLGETLHRVWGSRRRDSCSLQAVGSLTLASSGKLNVCKQWKLSKLVLMFNTGAGFTDLYLMFKPGAGFTDPYLTFNTGEGSLIST